MNARMIGLTSHGGLTAHRAHLHPQPPRGNEKKNQDARAYKKKENRTSLCENKSSISSLGGVALGHERLETGASISTRSHTHTHRLTHVFEHTYLSFNSSVSSLTAHRCKKKEKEKPTFYDNTFS